MKIAIVSSWLPRECGIATFSRDVAGSLKESDEKTEISICALQEPGSEGRKYGPEVKWKIRDNAQTDYTEAAKAINNSDAEVIFLSHEFGIFGPKDGKNILFFLEQVKKPVISTFHTIPLLPGSRRRKTRLAILKKIAEKSHFVIVTSQHAKKELAKKFNFEEKKIKVIYHGTPEIPFLNQKSKEKKRKELGLDKTNIIILSPGMIRKSKGLEYAIKAMAKIVKDYPEILYIITGEAHPAKKNWQYYQYLQQLVKKNKLDDCIKFIDYYLTDEELENYFAISDIILLPYLTKEQVSSGILAWALAAGKIIISTPFYYAKEVLENRGLFIKFRNAFSIEEKIKSVLENPQKGLALSRKAYAFGLNTNWKKTAEKYWEIFEKAKNSTEAGLV